MLIRWISITLSCLLFPALLLAQQPYRPLVRVDVPLSPEAEVYAFSGPDGATLFFREGQQARILLLDAQLQVVRNLEVYDLPGEQEMELLGFTEDPTALHLVYRSWQADAYYVVSVDRYDGQARAHPIDMGRLRERTHVYWGTFTYEGTLHILRMPRDSRTLRLCRFEGGSNFSIAEFSLDKADFLEKTQYALTRVDPAEDPQLGDTYPAGKMYHSGTHLYLTLEEPLTTYVVAIDLATGAKQEYNLPAPGFVPQPGATISYKNNSIILGQTLFQVAAGADSLKLHIRDLRTQAIVQAYQYGPEDRLDLAQGPPQRQDDQGQGQPLPDTRTFLAELQAAPFLALTAHAVADTALTLTLGAVRPVQVRGVTGMVLEERTQTTFITSLLHQGDYRPLAPAALDMAVQRQPVPAYQGQPLRVRLPGWQGRTWQGYYDARTGQYVLGHE